MCHIIPFATNASQTNIQFYGVTRFYSSSFLGHDIEDELNVLVVDEPGSSDKSWNMLSLHPTLHALWEKCLFGIKCLGIVPHDNEYSKIQLQFHWMPYQTRKPGDMIKTPYENFIREISQSPVNEQANPAITMEVRRDSGRELETGQTFEILAEKDDAEKMKVALDVRWAVVRLAAISGAARAWDLEDDPDECDDGGSIATTEQVEDWIETTSLSRSHREDDIQRR